MTPQLLQSNSNWLLDQSEAGICITGDSGKGKSVLMRHICRSVVENHMGAVFLFDPHGLLAKEVLADCLGMDHSIRKKIYYFEPGNEKIPVGCINPLAVPTCEGESDYGYYQRIDTKALHAAHLLLAAWGEDNFEQKPQLYKWTTLILRSLAQLGMTIPDSRFFLEVGTEIYHRLVNALPDPAAQWEFRQLAELETRDQMEILGSTKSRFFGLDAPIMTAHLGADPRQAIDVKRLMHEQAIVIVNLVPQGMLHEDRSSVLANFWLTEVFFTVFNMPESERVPTFVCCDELPTFRASAGVITQVLTQIRKMKTRFVGAFQGVHAFPKGAEDPLLKAMEQCGTTFIFNHKGTENAKYFGEMVQLPQHDPLKVKFEHWEEQQYQDGNEPVTLVDYAINAGQQNSESEQENWGESNDRSLSKGVMDGIDQSQQNSHSTGHHERQSNSHSRTDGKNEGQGWASNRDLVRTAYNGSAGKSWAASVAASNDVGESTTDVHQTGQSTKHAITLTNGTTQGESHGGSLVETKGSSVGFSQTWKTQLVPDMKWRDVLKFIEFFTGDELARIEASRITKLNVGEALMLSAGGKVDHVRIPPPMLVEKNLLFAKVVFKEFFRKLPSRVGYQNVPAIVEYRKKLLSDFSAEIRGLKSDRPGLTEQDQRRLAGPPDDTNLTI